MSCVKKSFWERYIKILNNNNRFDKFFNLPFLADYYIYFNEHGTAFKINHPIIRIMILNKTLFL